MDAKKAKKRAFRACLPCRARKVRCIVTGACQPCMNCKLDEKDCNFAKAAGTQHVQPELHSELLLLTEAFKSRIPSKSSRLGNSRLALVHRLLPLNAVPKRLGCFGDRLYGAACIE